MRAINADCKKYLRQTYNKEYFGKDEYNNFCRTIVEAFPLMKGDVSPNKHVRYVSFKIIHNKV